MALTIVHYDDGTGYDEYDAYAQRGTKRTTSRATCANCGRHLAGRVYWAICDGDMSDDYCLSCVRLVSANDI